MIDPSQFPEAISRQLREGLRARQMPHKFHYDTPRQAAAWLRVHETFSPARRDATCERMYEAAFQTVSTHLAAARKVDVISLGSGGGQKDAVLLRALRRGNPAVHARYVPADVSVSLSLISRAAAIAAGVLPEDCAPLVVDLAVAEDWSAVLDEVTRRSARRVVCFFGMLPNFEPQIAFRRLAALTRTEDLLLVSANLAPGADFAAAVEGVLPQYDNPLTREWLLGCLLNLGVERGDGTVTVRPAPCPHGSGFRRIEAIFTFARPRKIAVEGEEFVFEAGEVFHLFFSYRYTPARLQELARRHGLEIGESWCNDAGDEGVFLLSKAAGPVRARSNPPAY